MSGFLARSRLVFALVTLAVAMGVQAISSSQLAHAVPSADGARVAFALTTGGFSQIYTMNPDGSDVQPVPGQPASANNTDPATSPDGQQIAFTSNSSGNLDVWVIDLAGTNLAQLTTTPSAQSSPAWSPDGNTIAYQSDQSGNLDIWLMNPDGTGQTKLTSNPANDAQPAWFPTGRKIAFQSSRTGTVDIYTVNADGTGIKRLTTSSAPDSQPSVGPGGGTIAFTSRRNSNTDIYTVPADGGTNVRVTSNTATENHPAFSTDGRWLAFTSNRTGINQVFAMPRPAGAAVQLTKGANPASSADYMPYAYPSPVWSGRVSNLIGMDDLQPNAIAASPDGTMVFSVGSLFAQGVDRAGYIAAYSSTGTLLWTQVFSDSNHGGAYAVAVSPDSSTVYVGGYTFDSMFIGAYDATTGSLIQSKELLPSPASFATVWTMVASADGNSLFFAGTEYNSKGLPIGAETMALATNTFATAWQEFYFKADPAIGSMRLSPTGDTVYWVGDHYGTPVYDPLQFDYFTVAYRTGSGTYKWSEQFNGFGPGNEDNGLTLAVSPDGTRVFVSGWSWDGPFVRADQSTVAYLAANGSTLWTRRYDSGVDGYDWANSIAVSPDGSTLYAAGSRSRMASGKQTNDFLTTSLNANTGGLNWARFYNGPGDYVKDDAADVACSADVSPDGTLFVTGQSFRTGTSFDLTTVGYDPSGARVWLSRYDGPAHARDYGAWAALSSDGSELFVTGGSMGTSHFDGATVSWNIGGALAHPIARRLAPPPQSAADRRAAPRLERTGPTGEAVPAAVALKGQLEAIFRSR